MRAKEDWGSILDPVSPRHPLEASNSTSSDAEVDIKRGIFQDERLPHAVYVDSITNQTIDEFEGRGIDLMIREVPMENTHVNAPHASSRDYGEHRNSPDVVLFDLDNWKVAGYEAKSIPAGENGMDQLRQWGEDIRKVNEFYGMNWAATGHDIQKKHINEGYKSPAKSPRGVYSSRDSLEKVRQSEEFGNVLQGLYGHEIVIDDVMLVSEVREEWNL